MPLNDHFHPPLSTRKSWEAIHGGWAFVIAQRLNAAILPKRFESEQQVHLGTSVEIDVATYEDEPTQPAFGANGGSAPIATVPRTYAPPAPTVSGEVTFTDPDLFEVQVYKDEGGWKLVAAIELISPSNKDRKTHRRAFATKVASYLQRGVSVVTVDVVTERQANLHETLIERLDLSGDFAWSSPSNLSAITYRIAKDQDRIQLDVWPFELTLGSELPIVPLWIGPNLAVPLELELTYTTTYQSLIKDS